MKNSRVIALAALMLMPVFTAFSKVFHIYNLTGSVLWVYTYCSEERANKNDPSWEDMLVAGKEDHWLKDAPFICNPVVKIGFALKRHQPTFMLERGNDTDEAFLIRTDRGNITVVRTHQLEIRTTPRPHRARQ